MDRNETIAIIRSLLSSTNSAYSIYNLNVDFKNETGVDIPLFGYSTLNDFLYSVPDTVKVTGVYPIQQVSLVTNNKSAHIVSLVERQRNIEQKKKHIINRIKKLPSKSAVKPRSKNIQKAVPSWKKTAGDSFKIQSYGLENEILPTTTELLSSNRNLTLASNFTNRCISLQKFLLSEESIPIIDLQHHIQVGGYIEVRLCKIITPHHFYFQFRKFRKKFSDLMKKLQLFYASNEEIPTISREVVRPQLTCAVFHKLNGEAMWHRAEIHEVVNSSRVIVNFFDHGDSVEIPIENLKYLHRDFSSVSRQAFLGSLANINPFSGDSDWSPRAIKRFSDLSIQRDLVAGVVNVDPKSFSVNVALSCTGSVEVHINDTLVREGFAEFDVEILECHFTEVLKASNCRETAVGDLDEVEQSNEKIKRDSEKAPSENILKTMENTLPLKHERPVFYLPINNCENKKLKKMFSFFGDFRG